MTNKLSRIIGTCAFFVISSSVMANATAKVECNAADAPCTKTDSINKDSFKTIDLMCVDTEGHNYAPTSQSYFAESQEVTCISKNKTEEYFKYECNNNSQQHKREITFDIKC